jgi:RNA polymerase sigma-70 factor (ECF subfamily)
VDEIGDLLLRARDGDRWAFGTAARLLEHDLRRMATHLVGPDEADDVAQEALLRLWLSLGRFRGEAGGRTYAYSIARRTCVDAVRRRLRRRRVSAALGTRRVDTVDGGAFTAVHFDDLLRGLDGDRTAAFVLTQLIGLSYAEAAEVCEVPIGTIRSRVARAREDLVAAWQSAENTA